MGVVPIVTAFTPAYYERANTLRRDCEHLDIPFVGIPYIDRGTWFDNCRAKPSLLFEAGIQEPHLFVDADSRILRVPELLHLGEIDLATPRHRGNIGRDLYGGVMYLGGTEWTFAFLALWRELTEIEDEHTEEYSLTLAYRACKKHIKWRELPKQYAVLPQDKIEDPIIEIGLSGKASRWNRGDKYVR